MTRHLYTVGLYHHLQGNENSSGLHCEVAYWPALAVGGAAQLAAIRCPNERTLDREYGNSSTDPPKAMSTLSQKGETVAQKWDCRRKRRDNGDSLTFLRQCGQALRYAPVSSVMRSLYCAMFSARLTILVASTTVYYYTFTPFPGWMEGWVCLSATGVNNWRRRPI